MSAKMKRWTKDGQTAFEKEIAGYFETCRKNDTPATPAGLALALGLRTADLSSSALPLKQRRIIGRALQRIEAETMERALGPKGSAKGMEIVLQQTQDEAPDELESLSDEELDRRLAAVAAAIAEAMAAGL